MTKWKTRTRMLGQPGRSPVEPLKPQSPSKEQHLIHGNIVGFRRERIRPLAFEADAYNPGIR
jgi:hypothetical protein